MAAVVVAVAAVVVAGAAAASTAVKKVTGHLSARLAAAAVVAVVVVAAAVVVAAVAVADLVINQEPNYRQEEYGVLVSKQCLPKRLPAGALPCFPSEVCSRMAVRRMLWRL